MSNSKNMILPIIFLHFSLFIVAHSNPEENVEKFNQFINTFFQIKPSSPSTSHAHAHAQHLNYAELSKFLFQVEENVVNGVLHEGQPKIDAIYKQFQNALTTKESSLLGNLLPNRHNKEKHEELKSHLATFYQDEQGKVQFIMLLLSFATRLAYTIGSEVLKKQKWTRKIQMNLFLNAYEKMEKAYHVENRGDNAKYRYYYYQGANLYPNDKDNNMRFQFVKIQGHAAADMRKNNHKKLILFSRQKHRVSRLIKLLEQIDQYSQHHELSDREYFFTYFMMNWNQNYPDPEYSKVKIFALKRFGMNLASHILRQEKENSDARAYFRYDEHGPAKNKLKNLFGKLKKAVEELGPFNINHKAEVKFMNEQEMFMHYEDALELDWRPQSYINSDAIDLFAIWSITMVTCNSKLVKVMEENEARLEKIKKENEAKLEEIEKENETRIEEINKENEAKLEDIEKENETRIEEMQKENEARIEEMEKENEARIEKINNENKPYIAGMKKKFDENKAFLESLMMDYNIAELEHDFEEILKSMTPLNILKLALEIKDLSTKVRIAIQEEFNGLTGP